MSTVINNRIGNIHFHDASLNIMEEMNARTFDERKAYGQDFKAKVFQPIIQLLRKLGWSVNVPEDMIKQYSLSFAQDHRYCRKGDLEGMLTITGRSVQFETWQSVANIDRKDGLGRHEFEKTRRMPYTLRLEMLRTRIRIKTMLMTRYPLYTFTDESPVIGISGVTAKEAIMHDLRGCWHFKKDLDRRGGEEQCGNNKSKDNKVITHGATVYTTDSKGRLIVGEAFYNINNMWWVISGKYGRSNKASFEIYVDCPGDIRVKRNERMRRAKLESELNKATAAMDFKRAELLKNILFPNNEPLFVVRHTGHRAYHRANFSGYTDSVIHAGKFTKDELRVINESTDKVIPLEEAMA